MAQRNESLTEHIADLKFLFVVISPKMSSGCRFPLAIFFTPTHLSSKGSHSLGRVIVQFPPSREHALLHGTKLARSELNYPSKESLCYWVDGFVAAKKDVYSRKMEGRCRQFKIRKVVSLTLSTILCITVPEQKVLYSLQWMSLEQHKHWVVLHTPTGQSSLLSIQQ